ncbi:NAD(P)-dependent dehydrogenase, short-chain alcohol dehydrogenase family [Sphingomonas laterariae]|uniref:NAD(P)-dependent dehydrogenase, short-chain alcohol dehydrogenase family n=1 Tax=Edaphosphingomonas laterariae TaxID=861865 RepID=A0A239GYS6_9SPHN|nr:glucose 1-dehydrogenase [Sphingomonas laterariae]SNS73174.1 NAD(P)-dependent dehydrogenase, short-chain alcohol dehydrogenase family [Sphingomonas laterariae]
MIDFAGKIALVTGGGVGIGRATCEAFAKAGATVVTIEKDAERAADVRSALGDSHVVIEGDVTVQADVDALAKTITDRFGGLDVLVNNVGDFLMIVKRFEDHTDEDIERLYATNMRQIFSVTRAMIPLIRKRGPGGSIISVSSIEGFRGIPFNSVYSAFKTGVTGFTKSLALDLAPEGIRVNLIAPETTDTPQVAISQYIKPEFKDSIKQWIPLGRFGTPEDMAGGILFLASPLASWMTGTALNIDGGALAASGWYRTAEGKWTNVPVIPTDGLIF